MTSEGFGSHPGRFATVSGESAMAAGNGQPDSAASNEATVDPLAQAFPAWDLLPPTQFVQRR